MANRSRVPLSKRFKKPPKKMTDAQFLGRLRSLLEDDISLNYLTKEAEGKFAAEAAKKKNKGGSVKRLKKKQRRHCKKKSHI